jgi:RecA-family ATPase
VQKWIILDLLEEGAVLVVAGSPKTGKTIFTLHQILNMKGLVPPLAGYKAVKGTEKFPIGYFNEMGEKQLKIKIQEVKPGITDATIAEILGSIEIWDKMPILDTAGLTQFEAQIVKHGFRVFVIDTVARVRPPMRGTDVALADARFVDSIAQVARRTNCCIILLTQNNKPRGATESFTDRIGHTNQFLAAADDYVSIYRRHDDDPDLNRRRYMVAAGRNIKETDEMILTLNGDGLHIDGSTYKVEATEAQQAVLECLRHAAPMTPRQIATAIGKKREAVRNVVERMITKETLMRIGQRGCVTTPARALALRSKARREAL